jgi:hypothetical protein
MFNTPNSGLAFCRDKNTPAKNVLSSMVEQQTPNYASGIQRRRRKPILIFRRSSEDTPRIRNAMMTLTLGYMPEKEK